MKNSEKSLAEIKEILFRFNLELSEYRQMTVEAITLVSKRLFNQLGVTPSELSEVLNNSLNGLEEIPRPPDSNMITSWVRIFRKEQPKDTTDEYWDRDVNNTPEEEAEIDKIIKGIHSNFEQRQENLKNKK